MSQARGGATGTGARLAARLLALGGVAPDPVRHVVFRWTRRLDGAQAGGYFVPGETGSLDPVAFDEWLAQQPASIDRLAVAVLVIREIVDTDGQIVQCTLERRRGSADGPFCGDPARVEFTGAATAVRLYRSRQDGRLTEIAPPADAVVTRVRPAAHFVGERRALQARFGEGVRTIDAREPTLFEDLAGLSSIVHVQTPDGREVGCGIGWHGEATFVLEADFPRFAAALEFTEEDTMAVDGALRANNLVRGETRLDAQGIAVVGRRRGGNQLFLVRPAAGHARVEAHTPGREAASPDQLKWMRYAETYEGLTVLDVWRDGTSSDVLVVTGDATGEVWRHHIDADGVENWRRSDTGTAVGLLHRERLFPGSLAEADAEPRAGNDNMAVAAEQASPTAPAGSLLAYVEAYVRAMSALYAARLAFDAEADDVATYVTLLRQALPALEVHSLAALAQPEAASLMQMEDRLRSELALLRCVIVAPPRAGLLWNKEAFGRDVAIALPALGYDVEEAATCLALRRPTAAVFHCMKIMERGIATLARRAGTANPVATGERQWRAIMRALRGAADVGLGDALQALDGVRRRWRGVRLMTADKYTEEEAELIFQAVGAFLQVLAQNRLTSQKS